MDKKERLFYVLLAVFVLWVGSIIFFLVPKVIGDGETLDPTMQIVTALGVGSITQALIVLLTLSWQFWFRKKSNGDRE